ncbi:hypothetical protein QTP86_022697 [Hemibagrus guttatus]|nr:hypothetical protein QTP86_022697 [Hemibagrus guttatus]
MWRYKQPGFALHLLCELQKQQQCSLHCDILLQTEGVSIPAHSCVLSALSPVFYRAFANAPSLPVGQSRLVQLEAIGAHALMKLVGFMYSGVMEGESLDEQQEVIDIACRLGFSNFMEGKQKQVNRHQKQTASWREIGLQTEDTEGRKKDASIQILSETQFIDTCVASEPELSIDLPDELTDVAREYNSISPDTDLARIDEIVAHSPSKSTEALVKVHAKCQQTQKEKKRRKNSKKGGTQISLKIKLKRQRSGALWEIASVQEESTGDGSKTCGSSDDPPMTHSLAETHKSSADVQLSSSPSLTWQNFETVTLTPPSELTTPLPATPIRPPSEHFCPHAPDPSPFSSTLQMPPLPLDLSQPEESIKHIAKLLEMVTVGLNILPSVTMEGNSSMPAHMDQKLEKCAAVTNSPASYLCLLGHNLGTVESGTTSSTSEQREAGTKGLAQNITKIKDVINECGKNNVPEPEKKSPFIEPEQVTPDMNLNREENKHPKRLASLTKKTSFCDKIFHQTVFSPDTTVTQHFLPINQLRSVLQTSDRKIRTSLPPSFICKKIREPPEPEHLSAELMMNSNKQKKKDTTEESDVEKGVPRTDKPDDVLDRSEVENVDSKNRADSGQDESSSRNVNGCLVNGNCVREAEINVNTGLSIHEDVDLNAASGLCPIPTVGDFNNHFGIENHLQLESSTTLLCPFRPETMMEKPKVDEEITESLGEVPVSNKPTEDKLIKTKELHSEGTGTQIGHLKRQEGEKKENTVRRTEHVEISRMNDNEAEISDIDIDVVDESLQLVTDHGYEVIATAGNVGDNDVEENQISILMDNDGQALAHEEELNGQQVLRTEVEVIPPDEVDMTSEMINTEASSIPHGEEPDLSSFSVDTVGSSAVFLPNLNAESAEDYNSAEEELVVDDISDSPHQPCIIVGTQCEIILEEEDEWRDEEEDEVDVTGEESN